MDDSDKIQQIFGSDVPQYDNEISSILQRLAQFITLVFNKTVPTNFTTGTITFQTPQSDINYLILAMPSWLTTISISNKTINGYTVTFGTQAPANSTIDYIIIRQP